MWACHESEVSFSALPYIGRQSTIIVFCTQHKSFICMSYSYSDLRCYFHNNRMSYSIFFVALEYTICLLIFMFVSFWNFSVFVFLLISKLQKLSVPCVRPMWVSSFVGLFIVRTSLFILRHWRHIVTFSIWTWVELFKDLPHHYRGWCCDLLQSISLKIPRAILSELYRVRRFTD